jgi:hypothetical protein
MKDTPKVMVRPLNPGEAHTLKARAYDLSELAAKQALYGIIQVLSVKSNVSRRIFEEVIDDAEKYNNVKKGGDIV